jgi:hypothetical protein
MSRKGSFVPAFLAVLAFVAAPAFAASKKMSEAKPSGIPVGKVLQSSAKAYKSPTGGPITFYTSKAAFDAAHPGLPCEDYQDFTDNLVGCPCPANSTTSCPGGYGVGAIHPGLEIAATQFCNANGLVIIPTGFDGNPSIVFGSNYFVDETRINLTNVPFDSALGLEISCHFAAPSVNVTVFDSLGTMVGSTTSACASAGTFLGMDSSAPEGLGHVLINEPGGAAVESTDNVCHGDPVPVELQDFQIED